MSRPGYALFEATKRFLQAQGIFGASTLVLFIAAPINAVLYFPPQNPPNPFIPILNTLALPVPLSFLFLVAHSVRWRACRRLLSLAPLRFA